MPRIVTAAQMGLAFQNLFGDLGPELNVTGHHTAGPKDKSTEDAIRLVKLYHRDHKAKGWGGLGYHYFVTRGGVILCCRPTRLKGAHVGGWNTGNIGIAFHGTTGDRMTRRQAEAYRWLLLNAHTKYLPAAHRTDRRLHKPYADRRGHKQWPGHAWNECPGTHLNQILTARY